MRINWQHLANHTMPDFSSHRSFALFVAEVLQRRRYVRSAEQMEFLAALLDSARNRVQVLPPGFKFWRARRGAEYVPYYQDGVYIDHMPSPHAPAEMKPRVDRALEGRANPKGIAHLYGASNRDTAVAEVRPWAGAHVSVGILRTSREQRVVNCTSDDRRHTIYFDEPSPMEREAEVWNEIDERFARPVQPSDDTASYAPTQIIAEALRADGYDGLFFRSSLGDGLNLVLFDPSVADLIHCEVVYVRALKVEVEKDPGPYSVWTANAADNGLGNS